MVAKILRHKFQSIVADGSDMSLVRPSNWNDDHNLWWGYRSVTATGDAISHADHMSLVEYNNAGGVNVSIAAPTPPATMPRGWFVRLRNIGAGPVVLIGTGGANINGQATFEIEQGEAVDVHSRGTADYIGVALSARRQQASMVGGGGTLRFVNPTALSYLPFRGGDIIVNGRAVPLSAGVAGLMNSAVFVNGVPNQTLVPDTNYFVYGFMNGNVLTADFSTTGHATSGAAGNVGTQIKHSDDTRSLIGYIRTNASGQFADSLTQRYVRSWFNDPGIHLQNWFTASRSTTSMTPIELNEEIRIFWINFADELIRLTYTGPVQGGVAVLNHPLTFIAVDGAADLEGSYAPAATYAQGYNRPMAARLNHRPSEGYHSSSVFARSWTGNLVHWTVWSNDPSNRPTLEGVIRRRP
ncbi:MAG: hypothetical protein C5B54_07285 [Acidobacteria bacterium]|nr:MAG: hypothetical protein C5B54_07285 [Acidobacteriota bacterium]